ncbi:DNA ligase [Shewanella phage vB_SspS_KASIA]|nr:DNA ligase [Shewanella phage vB_SspS_KASIA]
MILDILEAINKEKGKKKVELLSKHKGNILLQELWFLTYGRVKFHTNVIVEPSIGDCGAVSNYGAVVALLDKLRCKVVTGNAAKGLITDTLSKLNPRCIEIYNRVIKGNLKCGIGEKAGNEVWGKDFIKPFPVMLISAHCPKKAAKIISNPLGAVMQLKSDGVRCIVHGEYESDIKFYSRQGEEFHGLSCKFEEAISEFTTSMGACIGAYQIDGEMVYIGKDGVHDPRKAAGIMNSCIHGTASEDDLNSLHYIIWDITAEKDDTGMTYLDRLACIQYHFHSCYAISVVPSWKVTTLEEVHQKYNEILESGNEGVVLKSLSNVWADKRVTDCIKYKAKHQAEFMITGWYKGEDGNEMCNVIGGYEISSACGRVIANTGSGLTFKDRNILTEVVSGKEVAVKDADGYFVPNPDINNNDLLGKIVTIEYNARTLDKKGRDTYSLRFPIFNGIRFDKTEADILEIMIAQESSTNGLRT